LWLLTTQANCAVIGSLSVMTGAQKWEAKKTNGAHPGISQ